MTLFVFSGLRRSSRPFLAKVEAFGVGRASKRHRDAMCQPYVWKSVASSAVPDADAVVPLESWLTKRVPYAFVHAMRAATFAP